MSYAVRIVKETAIEFYAVHGRFPEKIVLPPQLYELYVEATAPQPGEFGAGQVFHRLRFGDMGPIDVQEGDVSAPVAH